MLHAICDPLLRHWVANVEHSCFHFHIGNKTAVIEGICGGVYPIGNVSLVSVVPSCPELSSGTADQQRVSLREAVNSCTAHCCWCHLPVALPFGNVCAWTKPMARASPPRHRMETIAVSATAYNRLPEAEEGVDMMNVAEWQALSCLG